MPWLTASTPKPQNRHIIASVKLCSRVDICSNDAYISIGNPTKIMHERWCAKRHTNEKRRTLRVALKSCVLAVLLIWAAIAAIVALLRPQRSLASPAKAFCFTKMNFQILSF